MLFVFCVVIVLLVVVVLIVRSILKYKNSNCKIFCPYVLVLGAKVLNQNTPCKILETRLNCAYDYLQQFKDSKVIVSGGKGKDEPISESYVMRKVLISYGVRQDRIIMEDSSVNTFQNLKNTRRILGNVDEILIITSNYHLFRSKILARRVGFKKVSLIGSDVFVESLFKNLVREVFAVMKSILFDW